MKYLVLINPSSHGGRAARVWRGIQPLLQDAEWYVLKSIEEARELARMATGYETSVACGGDGTINAVADGVMANADEKLSFGVIYAGTSPDFCRFHGIPTEPKAAIELLEHGVVREVPVLMANGRCFFCSCNVGMGADVAAAANRLRPWLGDKLGTFLALMRSLLRGQRWDFTVGDECISQCNHLLFTRMPYIASGLKLALPTLKDDEYAMWFVRNQSFWNWMKMLTKIYRGESCGELRISRETQVVACTQPVGVEYDGDPHGTLPVEISLAPRRLRLIATPIKEASHA